MKKYFKIVASALCIVMLAGCGGNDGKDKMPVEEEAKATSVEIENPTLKTVKDEYMYTGTIQAADTVDVSAKVQGTVAATYFEVGSKVTKGAVLYKIDDTDYRNALKTAEAGLNSANAGLRSAQTGVATANGATMKTQLESAQNAITNCETNLQNAQKSVSDTDIAISNAQTNYDKAKNDYDMNQQLFAVGGISEDALNNSKIAYEQAENALTTAKNSKEKAELSVKSAEDALLQAKNSYEILSKETTAENTRRANDALTSAQASVKSASVAVENAKQQIAYCTVTSPITGTVLSKKVTTGAMASGVGYQIVDLSNVNVTVNASEQIATTVKVGDAVTIKIPSLSNNDQMTGSITEIPPSANADGTYTVKISIPNPDGKLKGGMFTEVYFAKSTSNNAVILPRDSVIDDNGKFYVYKAVKNKAVKTEVEIGIDTGDTIEVTSGITIDDKIVTKGQTYLTDGDKLNVVADNGVEVEQESKKDKSDKDSKKSDKKDKKPADDKEAKK